MQQRKFKAPPNQRELVQRRLPIVAGLLVVATVYLIGQLVGLQYQPPSVVAYMERQANASYFSNERVASLRGIIFDREGQPLANNTFEYEIGISPNLIPNSAETARTLAPVLNLLELDLKRIIDTNATWVSLAKPVSPEVAEDVRELDILGVTIDSEPRRLYPQGILAAQLLGFVAGDQRGDQGFRGYNGVEGYYENELAGRVTDQTVSQIPFDLPQDREESEQGSSLVLTIDRDVQYLIEAELIRSITESGAESGTIIVMDPRTGDILGMASYPSYDPNAFYDVEDEDLLRNPAISDEYEPGSVMKVITIAVALQKGTIIRNSTYVDDGSLQVGGITIQNSDRQPKGVVDMTQLLAQSLNVGAATVSIQMGPTAFYEMFDAFGFGRSTGIDLEGEANGTMLTPLDSEWSESNLATNSFGQGISVTPLQMITAIAAIANDGLMMQPHIVHQYIDGSRVYPSVPTALGRPISRETANIVTDMMVVTVQEGAPAALVPGYSVAGKTGTAQIATPLGYRSDGSIVTFVGFVPADEPQVVVLIKLDRPTAYWGSIVAAPVFSRLAERLVVLLEIPSDDVRRALAANTTGEQ